MRVFLIRTNFSMEHSSMLKESYISVRKSKSSIIFKKWTLIGQFYDFGAQVLLESIVHSTFPVKRINKH